MLRQFSFLLTSALLVTVGCTSTPDSSTSAALTGGGSTFVYPLMVQWTNIFEKSENGFKVDYQSVGSDNGIKGIITKKRDFGCTDAPMTEDEMAAARSAGGEVLHIPLVLGAVVPAYNLPDVKGALQFSGPVLADIFLGKITKWNDEAFKKLNPGVNLPDKNIILVNRRDGSGTTYIWTDYLAKVSPDWKKKVGHAMEVTWPVGKAEVGNDGVAKFIKENTGSLGYVELSYAYRFDISFGTVQNRTGAFIKANLPSVKAAAASALVEIPGDLRYSLTDAPGNDSYPICGTTWAVFFANQPAGKGKQLVDFLHWAIDEGQSSVEELFYARLPESLVARAKEKLEHVELVK